MLINFLELYYNPSDTKMPIIRKVIDVGRSKAVTIPKTWLDYYEKEAGKQIEAVAMEVNKVLTIKPIFTEEAQK